MMKNVNRVAPGFLLIELLVSLFLIGVLSVIVSGIYVQTMHMQRRALDLLEAVELATYTLNTALITEQYTGIEQLGKFSVERGITADPQLGSLYNWISCTVSWNETGGPQAIVLKKGIAHL